MARVVVAFQNPFPSADTCSGASFEHAFGHVLRRCKKAPRRDGFEMPRPADFPERKKREKEKKKTVFLLQHHGMASSMNLAAAPGVYTDPAFPIRLAAPTPARAMSAKVCGTFVLQKLLFCLFVLFLSQGGLCRAQRFETVSDAELSNGAAHVQNACSKLTPEHVSM